MKFVEKLARNYLRKRGYSISECGAEDHDGDYRLVRYSSYDQYVSVQTEGNKRKINQVWADEATIDVICDYIRKTIPDVKRGLCHGSRNGTEVRWFSERLGIDVMGTDISDTASQFGLTQWDFHNENPAWEKAFDFVYTNSHDHAHDPKKAFTTWVGQLAAGGKLFIEHSVGHAPAAVSTLDPFGIDPKLLPYAVLGFGDGKFAVTDVLKPDHKKAGGPIWVFVIERVHAN